MIFYKSTWEFWSSKNYRSFSRDNSSSAKMANWISFSSGIGHAGEWTELLQPFLYKFFAASTVLSKNWKSIFHRWMDIFYICEIYFRKMLVICIKLIYNLLWNWFETTQNYQQQYFEQTQVTVLLMVSLNAVLQPMPAKSWTMSPSFVVHK